MTPSGMPAGHQVLRRPHPADRHPRLGVLPDPVGLLRVHHAGGAGGAGHEHHRRAGRDPDGRRRGAPAHRAPVLPGARVGDRAGRDLGRRPGLAGVPGADLPARLGKDFWAKEIYLGVRLGQRGVRAQLSGGCFPSSSACTRAASEGSGSTMRRSGTPEITKWTDQAERLGRALNASALAAQARDLRRDRLAGQAHADADGGRAARPSATKRRRWGAGEIDMLFEGQIHNGRTLLRLEHKRGSRTPRSFPSPGSPM
jgi:hypothetical protein